MNFVSFEFAAFLAVVYVLHWSCRRAGTRKWLLTIASYVFYAVWNWRFCFLMLFVTINAFAAGQMLAAAKRGRRTPILAASIGTDLAILGFFKYYDFFLSNVAATLADLGVAAILPVLRIILPVGISFYTFHAISYVVDVYRGKVESEPSFVNIALYISFFPQLIAGPIVRASFIVPQIRQLRSFSGAQQAIGVRLLLRGFIYKAAIADTLAQIADPVFAHIDQYDAHALLTATIAFYGQIYFDFAGYSSMAIGTARLFGYRFPPNFNYPYRAASVTEFWRRWHMSLSFWLRRLPLHPAWRQPGRLAVRLPQSDDHNAARRALARCCLELRGLGRAARRRTVRQQAVARDEAASSDADRRAQQLECRRGRANPALGHARLGVLSLRQYRPGHRAPCGDFWPAGSPGLASAPGRGLYPRDHRNRSPAWEHSPAAVAVAPMGGGICVERARSLVRPGARGHAGCAETVHLLPVLRRSTRVERAATERPHWR
jgi:hypothetical protein